ncbi:PREDICTED: crossover junction endonuclease MUS81 [Gekko japonicus]|uniref:Crossover junction endonuclease MUS81 n=1 Tax=Gekko japonicus TaxID=146911 RepID=A0ABM1L0B8_GEKJA|nr:PREDICTED: crossover junction endonuclease MUS81 [Gekko japonicus]
MPKRRQEFPNPLFRRWLEEWRDQAAERGRFRLQRAYERALSSLHKYPLPLRSGREARILQYFGEHICRQLDEQLEKHRFTQEDLAAPTASWSGQEDGDPPGSKGAPGSDIPVLLPVPSSTKPDQPQEQHLKKTKPASHRRARRYFPAQRSGAYAVLVALYQDSIRPHTRGYLTKPELQRAAQPLCDKSFFPAGPGSKATAWSAVSTLICKELVLKTNIPARYSLTETGLVLGKELLALGKAPLSQDDDLRLPAAGTEELLVDSEGDDVQRSDQDASPEEPRPEAFKPLFTFHPGQFDVILCVDFIETTGGPTSRKQDFVNELERNGVPFSIRKLHIGDFLWVARERHSPVAGQLQPLTARELVLDYVVERKRMPDLCSSIMDGRFREQKFRLRQCGISHPIYLVEDSGSVQHLSLPEKTLQQAITNTQVVDGFFVKRTHDIRESAAYLTIMTRHLTKLYGDKTLLCCTKEELERECPLQPRNDSCMLMTFAEFNEGAMKNKPQTVNEVFARQLMQISGISGEKAAAILERYKTPASLLAAYAACKTASEKEQLLSGIRCGKLQRNLGPALSKTLAQLYCTPGPLP